MNSVLRKNYKKKSLCNVKDELLLNKLTNLNKLDLSNNYLTDLPYFICLLKNLQYLVLNNNKLSYLPNVIGDMKELISLKIQNNNIKEVPENIGNLLNLEDLDLSFNKLTDIPCAYKMLNKLKYLSLTNNNLTCIPDCIKIGMSSLEILDLSENNHIMLDIPLCSTNIKKLYAIKNDVCPSFPNWIFNKKYNQLEELLLDYTVFQEFHFPSEEMSILNITNLSMIQCNLSEYLLSDIFKRLKSPESLNIGNDIITRNRNLFWTLPIQDIKIKSSLKEINIRKANISIISICINEFLALVTIDISYNSIIWLPDEICDLHNLQNLIINNNFINNLPNLIGQLALLKTLKANSNALNILPTSMKDLNNLQFLDLYDNELFEGTYVNINMTTLQGIDLEQNYFSTNDLPIKENYKHLRDALLVYSNEQFREIGIKKETNRDDDKYFDSSSSSDTNNDKLSEEQASFEWTEENWDESDNSAEEFDPNECWRLKSIQCSPLVTYKRKYFKKYFCPADLHAKPIAENIRKMLNIDTLSLKTEFETSQFEDA